LCISEIDIAGVGVGFEMEISFVDLLVAEFRPNPIATPAIPAITHMTARRIGASLPVQIEIGVLDVRAGNSGEKCELLHTSNHHCLDGNNERLL